MYIFHYHLFDENKIIDFQRPSENAIGVIL